MIVASSGPAHRCLGIAPVQQLASTQRVRPLLVLLLLLMPHWRQRAPCQESAAAAALPSLRLRANILLMARGWWGGCLRYRQVALTIL